MSTHLWNIGRRISACSRGSSSTTVDCYSQDKRRDGERVSAWWTSFPPFPSLELPRILLFSLKILIFYIFFKCPYYVYNRWEQLFSYRRSKIFFWNVGIHMVPNEGGPRHLVRDTKVSWIAKRRMVTGQRVRKSCVWSTMDRKRQVEVRIG